LRNNSNSRVFLFAASMFFTLGMLAAIGPALPEIARNNNSSLAATGAVFTALFFGAVLTQVASGWLNERYGVGPVLAVGSVIMSVGMFGATLSRDLPLTLALMGIAGLGDGLLVVGANVMVVQTFTKRSASTLNLLNVFFGLGAIAAPALVGLSIGVWGTALPPIWLQSGLLLLMVAGLPGLRVKRDADREREAAHIPHSKEQPFYRSPVVWTLGLILLLYVGVEVGTGGWVATYSQRTVSLSAETAAFMGSAFYLALTLGRLLAAVLGIKLRAEQLFMVSLAGASLGGLAMLAGVGNMAITIPALALVGISFGPIYPTILSVVANLFPTSTGRAASLVMAAGGVGGIVIPWLQGSLIEGFGAGTLALSVALGSLGMLALYGVVILLGRRHSSMAAVPAVVADPSAVRERSLKQA
jgi:fucose permease